MSDKVHDFIEQENLWHNEGRRGLVGLCKIAKALGYNDPMHFGQLESGATIGDFIEFIQDNPGCVSAIKEWIVEQNVTEWDDQVEGRLEDNEDDEYTDD